jgi:crossover junction endodeoxyribonuclease RuvC
MTILAIDPGTIKLGYCVVRPAVTKSPVRGARFLSSEYTVVEIDTIGAPEKMGRLDRLRKISNDLRKVFELHSPTVVVLERAYVGRSAQSAIALGEARGVVVGLVASKAGTQIVEYTANEARRLIGAGGHADKSPAHKVAGALLGLLAVPSPDAGDAAVLAAAYALGLQPQKEIS